MANSKVKTLKREKVLQQSPQQEDSENSTCDGSESENDEGNAGWADSIAKVLNTTKPKTKKILVLSRAKKIKVGDKTKPEQDYGFEVDGEIKEEKPIKEELNDKVKQRKNIQLALRVKPSWKDIERERALRKTATKGVVQLFNAVRIQQKDLQQQLIEAGPLDSRKDAVLNNINKRKFLDVLMSGNRCKSETIDNPVKNELKEKDDSSDDDATNDKKKSEWNVLREDFMTNKKIKHWDEEDSDENTEADDSNEDSDGEDE